MGLSFANSQPQADLCAFVEPGPALVRSGDAEIGETIAGSGMVRW